MGKFLKDPSPGVVAAAAYVLSGMGPAAAAHVAALEAALGNQSDTWRPEIDGKKAGDFWRKSGDATGKNQGILEIFGYYWRFLEINTIVIF